MGICVEMLYDQSNLNNFYNMELKKKKKIRKSSGFMCTIKVQPVLVNIFVFGVQTAPCFSTPAERALGCHSMDAKL